MSEVQRVTIDSDQARKWLNRYKADVQRPLRPGWVKQLAEYMRDGKFDQNSTIQLRRLGDEIHLVDGRHRLNAICNSGLPQSFYVITDEVTDRIGLVDAFGAINGGKPSTVQDYLFASGLEYETGLTRDQIIRTSGAMPIIHASFGNDTKRRMDIDERREMIVNYAPAAKLYLPATASAINPIKQQLRWAVTIAFGLVTFDESAQKYGVDKVGSFWKALSLMQNSGEGDPCGKASSHLIGIVPLRTNGRYDAKKIPEPLQQTARYLATCFNAFVADRNLKRVQYDREAPIVIYGSKYK